MQYHNIQCASANLIPWNESCNLRKGKSRNSAYMFMNRQPRIEEGAVLPVITLQAIDETIENLGYRNQKGTKSRLVQAIRAHYEHDDSILFVKSIDSDSLIRVLWANAFDPITIRNRRRNLSSIKSSVNADFKKLYREGKNPEGITISSSNTLVMSDEAKDSALEALRGGVDMEGAGRLGQLAGALNTLKDALSSSENLGELSKGQEPAVLHELRDLIGGLSEKIGVAGTGLPGDGGTTGGKSEDNSRIESLEKVRVSPETWLAEHSDFMGSDGGTASFPSESKGIADAADIETEEVEVPEETASEGDFEEVEEIDDTDTLEITDNPEIEEEEVLDVAEVEDEISEAEPIADLEGIADAADIETEEVEVPEEAALDGDFEEIDEAGLEEIEPSEESEALDEEVCEDAPDEGEFETIEPGEEVEEEDGIELSPEEFLDDIEEAEEEGAAEFDMGPVEEGPEDADNRGAAFSDEDFEFVEPESVDEMESAIEEAEATSEEEVEEIDDTDTLEITDNPEIEEEEVLDVAEVEDEISEAEPIADLEGIADAADIETEEVEVPEEAALEGDFEEVDGEGLEEIEASEESEALDEEVCEEAPAEEAFETIEAGDEVEEEEGSVGDIDSSEFTDDFREVGLLSKAVESGRLLEDLDEKNLSVGPGANQNRDNARLLSEKFNHSLAAMDRFFNQYVLIPRGIYPVGKTRPGTNEREKLHLDLAEFYMGKFPVTNALFEIFAEKTGYKSTAESVGYGTVYYGRIQREVDEETGLGTVNWSSSLTSRVVDGACWYQPLGPGSTLHTKRNHPVVQVSLEDALAFAAWTGKSLPTEDEWEAASRTAVGNLFPWGTRWEKDACNIEDTSAGRTTPVDQFMEWENDLGVADTLGNVWEWTSTALMDTSESSGKCYIAKGGSWVTGKSLDLVSRFKLEPQSHSNILGFRCVAV